jgi:hypothetical protein
VKNERVMARAPAAIQVVYAAIAERETRALVMVLTRAQEIIAEPHRWTRGALARSVFHGAVLPASDLAMSWSATGALSLALHEVLGNSATDCDRYRMYDRGIRVIWQNLPGDHPRTVRATLDIDGFNDYPGTEHHDIVGLFERSLLSARSGPSAAAQRKSAI